jgi:ribosomal-protein-alanine N-acetyltransferase
MLIHMARSELPHHGIDQTKDWISRMINSPQNGSTDFILTIKETGKAIGKMGVWRDREIGFLLDAKHWRKGLAQEALCALLPFFFVQKGYEKITADADPENKASLGLLKKLGFEVTGFEKNTFKIGEREMDSCYLELRKEQWEDLRKAVTA